MTQKEKIVKALKKEYPGCKIRVVLKDDYFNVRIIHPSFKDQWIINRTADVLHLVEDLSQRLFIIEPLTQEEWESRRW